MIPTNRIRRIRAAAFVAGWSILLGSTASANLLVNGDFEDGLNAWTFTGDGFDDTAGLSTDTPSGVGNSADLDINAGNFFPWLLQDVPVTVGDELTFSAWVREIEPNSPDGAWIAGQVWMLPDAGSGTIISSVALFFTNPDWEMQTTQIEVPTGATIARVLFTPQDTAFLVGTGEYRIDDVSLTADLPGFAADFDQDGDVDGDDFLLWQTGFPTSSGASKMDGDYDDDGDVDGDDFLGWQTEFPSPGSGAGSAATPEPASAGLFLAVIGAGIFVRRHRPV